MNRLTAIIICGLVIVIAGMYFRMVYLEHKLENAEDYKSRYQSLVESNKIWKDEAGHWRNKAMAGHAGASTLREMAKNRDSTAIVIRKEFKDVKPSFNNLESFAHVETKTESEIKGVVKDTMINLIKGTDTIKVKEKKLTAKNAWNKYDITIIGDSVIVKREGREEFYEALYWERKWFLGKKKWSNEIESKNPETKIIKQSFLIVRKKRK